MTCHFLRASLLALLLLSGACSGLPSPTDAETSGAAAGRSEGGNPGVLPVESRAFGRSYGEWSAAWWQWAYGIPVPVNPLFDETGARCGTGQSGKVWFLAGVFNASGTAVRNDCEVPTGTALFVPILNGECSNVEGNGTTEPEWRRAPSTDQGVEVGCIAGEPCRVHAQLTISPSHQHRVA